jgi:hypothetical protein
MRAKFVRAKRRKIAHESAKRRAGGGNDDDRIGGCGHGGLLILALLRESGIIWMIFII